MLRFIFKLNCLWLNKYYPKNIHIFFLTIVLSNNELAIWAMVLVTHARVVAANPVTAQKEESKTTATYTAPNTTSFVNN